MNGTAQAGMAVLALVYVAAVFLLRWAVSPAPAPGRHRRRRTEVLSEELRDELLGSRLEPVYGSPLKQAWCWCPSCLHTDGGWTCGHCFEPTIPTTPGSTL